MCDSNRCWLLWCVIRAGTCQCCADYGQQTLAVDLPSVRPTFVRSLPAVRPHFCQALSRVAWLARFSPTFVKGSVPPLSRVTWRFGLTFVSPLSRVTDASRAPYVLHGVKYIDLVPLALFSGSVPPLSKSNTHSCPWNHIFLHLFRLFSNWQHGYFRCLFSVFFRCFFDFVQFLVDRIVVPSLLQHPHSSSACVTL